MTAPYEWREFMNEHKGHITDIGFRQDPAGRGALYFNLDNEVAYDHTRGQDERTYVKFDVNGTDRHIESVLDEWTVFWDHLTAQQLDVTVPEPILWYH